MSNIGTFNPNEHYATGVGNTLEVSYSPQASALFYARILTDNDTTFTWDLQQWALYNPRSMGQDLWAIITGPMDTTDRGGIHWNGKVPLDDIVYLNLNPGVWRYSVTKTHSAQSKASYWHVYWYTNAGYTNCIADWTFSIWTNTSAKTSYTVSYANGGGGTAPSSQTKWYGENLTLRGSMTRPNTSPGSYTVTFNGNGGTSTTKTSTRTTSYSFSKWKASNGTQYNASATYTANSGTTMTAQWSSSETRAAITLPTSTRQNHTFNGWYTASSGGTKINGTTYTPTGNTTLYAQWTKIYESPKITDINAYRCDSGGEFDDEGSYLNVTCKGLIFNTSSQNSVSSFTCLVNNVTRNFTRSTLTTSSQYPGFLGFDASVIVDANLDTDVSYQGKLILTDTQGEANATSSTAKSSRTTEVTLSIASAFYAIDVLGDNLLFQPSSDTSVDSQKTYYARIDSTTTGEDAYKDVSSYEDGDGRNLLLQTATSATMASKAITAGSYSTYDIYTMRAKYSELNLTTNDSLTISFDWTSSNVPSGTVTFKVGTAVSPWEYFGILATLPAGSGSGHVEKTYKVTSALAAAASDKLRVRIDSSVAVSANAMPIVFSNVKLEKGIKATDWTPAPEDVTNPSASGWYEATGPKPGHGVMLGGAARKEGLGVGFHDLYRVAPTGTPTSLPGQNLPWTSLLSDLAYSSDGKSIGYSEIVQNGGSGDSDNFYRSFGVTRHFSDSTNSSSTIYVGVKDDKSRYFTSNATPKILWSGASYMHGTQTATLTQTVSEQFSGIVLAWSSYNSSTSTPNNYDWTFCFVPKTWVSSHGSTGVTHVCQPIPWKCATKYVYVYNDKIVGYANNTSSGTAYNVQYDNSAFVLRYVYGV